MSWSCTKIIEGGDFMARIITKCDRCGEEIVLNVSEYMHMRNRSGSLEYYICYNCIGDLITKFFKF